MTFGFIHFPFFRSGLFCLLPLILCKTSLNEYLYSHIAVFWLEGLFIDPGDKIKSKIQSL